MNHTSKDILSVNISNVMNQTIVTVELDDTLKTVKEIFENTKFHHLLVVENKILFGVISDRDLFKALSPNVGNISESASDAATLNKKVHQIMTRSPITLGTNADINDIIECFDQNTISCIPIIDNNKMPIGIVSWRDLLKTLKLKLKLI